MSTIYFSTAQSDHFRDTGHFLSILLSPMLQKHNIHLSVESIPWAKLWNFIQTRSLDNVALDVSEMGSTWVDSLADAGVLAEFTEDDLKKLGGSKIFTSAAWRGVTAEDDDRVLSIPMLTDTRLIFYWRDLLAEAHVHEADAFSTIESTQETLAALRAAGLPGWGAPTFGCTNNLHHTASWIWAKGGDFISPDRTHTLFCEENSLAGLASYFSLFAYMPGPFDSLTALTDTFNNRQVTAIIDGPWHFVRLLNQPETVDIARIGIALPPGIPFLGGSNLVLWKRAVRNNKEAALTLIEYLTSPEIQPVLCETVGLLPVRTHVALKSPYSILADGEAVRSAMIRGRHLPRTHLWAPLETALVQALGLVWQNIKTNQHRPSVDVVRRHLEPLAKRFDKMLQLF